MKATIATNSSEWSWDDDASDRTATVYLDGDKLSLEVVEIHTKYGLGAGKRVRELASMSLGTLVKPKIGQVVSVLRKFSHDRTRAGSPFKRKWSDASGNESSLGEIIASQVSQDVVLDDSEKRRRLIEKIEDLSGSELNALFDRIASRIATVGIYNRIARDMNANPAAQMMMYNRAKKMLEENREKEPKFESKPKPKVEPTKEQVEKHTDKAKTQYDKYKKEHPKTKMRLMDYVKKVFSMDIDRIGNRIARDMVVADAGDVPIYFNGGDFFEPSDGQRMMTREQADFAELALNLAIWPLWKSIKKDMKSEIRRRTDKKQLSDIGLELK